MNQLCPACNEETDNLVIHLQEDHTGRVKQTGDVIGRIELMMRKPNYRPQTSLEMKARAERIQSIRNGIRLRGGEVKDEYK